jgi:hypothetical protein
VLPLSRFLHIEDGEEGQPVLGVVDLGANKTMFLVRDEKLSFVRVAQSDQRGMSDLDIENVNMTIAYCRQVLRLNPSRVVFLGIPESGNTDVAPIIPVATAKYPSSIMAFENIITEHIIPLSALIHARGLNKSSLLPAVFHSINIQRKIMKYAIWCCVILSCLGLGYIGIQVANIFLTESEIRFVRKDISRKQFIIGEYEKVFGELQKREPLIKFMNAMNSTFDIQKVLLSLQVFSMDHVNVVSIGIRDEKSSLFVQVEGQISAASYKDLQTNFENLIKAIKNVNEIELTNQTLDIKNRNFRVDLKWKI